MNQERFDGLTRALADSQVSRGTYLAPMCNERGGAVHPAFLWRGWAR